MRSFSNLIRNSSSLLILHPEYIKHPEYALLIRQYAHFSVTDIILPSQESHTFLWWVCLFYFLPFIFSEWKLLYFHPTLVLIILWTLSRSCVIQSVARMISFASVVEVILPHIFCLDSDMISSLYLLTRDYYVCNVFKFFSPHHSLIFAQVLNHSFSPIVNTGVFLSLSHYCQYLEAS